LLDGVRVYGFDLFPWSDGSKRLRERAVWAGVTGLSDADLAGGLDTWLAPLLPAKRRLADIDAGALHNAMLGLIGWDGQQTVERLAPSHFTSPAGSTHAIDYAAEAGPTVELRVQALFGVAEHPVVGANRVPLVLSLTSPAGRPIQTTRDLPGFWKGSWADVAKDMRGRYPRHHWPDDPAAAAPSLKTKKRQGI
jgi:ATP-dependent helicase HrpB